MNIAITDAKAHLTELVRRAEAGEEIVLTRHGKPVVRLTGLRSDSARKARNLRLLELSAKIAREKTPGPDADHAADFLYDDTGMPG